VHAASVVCGAQKHALSKSQNRSVSHLVLRVQNAHGVVRRQRRWRSNWRPPLLLLCVAVALGSSAQVMSLLL